MEKSRKIVDLFCGAGGLSLGAARVGFQVIGAADNDSRVLAIHKKNFPNTIHTNIDLSKADKGRLLDIFGIKRREICGIVGGPPCQGFSSIGKRDGSDPRNLLFVDFFRIVDDIKPIFFLCENVPGLLRKEYTSVREHSLSHLRNDYTILPPIILNASDFGAPTSRTRAFFIGYRRDVPLNLDEGCFRPKRIRKITVKDALKGLPKKINPHWKEQNDWLSVQNGFAGPFFKRLRGSIPKNIGDPDAIRMLTDHKKVSGCIGTLHSKDMVERFKGIAQGAIDKISRSRRLESGGFCPTLRAGTGPDRGSFQAVRPIHYSEDRVITPREAARLQGFPDWFQFDTTKWHSFRLIGNSVSPILAERIFSVINRALILSEEKNK